MAETAKMVAELDLKTQKFTKGVQTAVGSVGKLSGAIAKSRAVSVALGVGLEHAAETGLRAVGSAITDGLNSLADLETAATANAAAIKQVGLAGKVTAGQIEEWSVQIETAVGSAFDDKEINAAAGTLIRFGKVTADNLRPALVVMTDLATKTGDVDSAATLLAKALADPEKAAGKLARSGVILTKAQQDQIKAFVKAGKTAQAQKVILDALSKTTAGAAKASQGPDKESINQLRDAYEEATKALAVGFLPVITKVRDILTKALARPETLARIRDFGKTIAAGLSSVVDFASKVNWGNIADRVGHAFGIIAGAVSVIRAGWDKIPDPLKNLLLGGIIADRTLKFLVNVSPIKIAVDFAANALAGLVGGVGKAVGASILGAGLGKFFIQPVFVTNPGFATGVGGGVPSAVEAGGAGLIATAAAVAVGVLGVLGLNTAAQAGAEQVNSARGTNFRLPAGFLDFPTILSNLQEAIKVFNNNTPKGTEGDIGGKIDSLSDRFHTDTVDVGGHIDSLGQRFPGDVAAAITTTSAARDKEISDAIRTVATGRAADDASFAATLAANIAAETPKFVATVKLDPSQITDLRGVTGDNPRSAQRDNETSDAIKALIVHLDPRHDAARRDAETSQSIQDLINKTQLVAQSSDISQLSGVTSDGLSSVGIDTINAGSTMSDAARQAGLTAGNAALSAGYTVASAIASNRPITNVTVNVVATTVQKTVDVVTRYGPPGGDRDSSDRNRYG